MECCDPVLESPCCFLTLSQVWEKFINDANVAQVDRGAFDITIKFNRRIGFMRPMTVDEYATLIQSASQIWQMKLHPHIVPYVLHHRHEFTYMPFLSDCMAKYELYITGGHDMDFPSNLFWGEYQGKN